MKFCVLGMFFLLQGTLEGQVGSLVQWTDAYLSRLPPQKHFRGTILVEQNGRILLKRSYGLADESWNVPNTVDSRLEIASVSKRFTAAAILQLAEAGRLSVHDSVSKYYLSSTLAARSCMIAI